MDAVCRNLLDLPYPINLNSVRGAQKIRTEIYRSTIHHDTRRVVVKHGRNILARKGIRGIRDQQACLSHGTITYDDTCRISLPKYHIHLILRMVETLRLSCTPRGFLPLQTGRGHEHRTDRGPSLAEPVARTLVSPRPAETCAQCKTIKTSTPVPTPPAKRGWIHIGRKPCMHRPINIYVCMCARATSKSQETYPGLSLAYIGNGRFPERFVIVPCVCPTVDHFSITTPSLPRESPIPLPSYVARCYDDEHDPLPALPYPNPFPTPPFFSFW